MVSPKPYGLHVISGELTDHDMQRIAAMVHRFLTFKDAAQIENLKKVYNLPDGGFFIVQEMGRIFRVIADKQDIKQLRFADDGLAKMYIPMFFSGVVEKAALRHGEKTTIKLTEQCRQRLYRQLEREVPKEIALERFSIAQSNLFPEFMATDETYIRRTQYYAQNPGWYSGTMSRLHQFVGGYGSQEFDTLPDDPVERAQYTLPETLLQELWDKYKEVRLPGYVGLPPASGQFQYDYKAGKTHAVAFDAAGRPWLIQVGIKVYAMPLPIIPITADLKFHQYIYEESGDSELIKVIETFGAFPSGESFPTGTAFQRWLRAGAIIEICSNSEYFTHIPMFQACGWSFNNWGNVAYNTAYQYDERGIIECSTFRLSLSLAESANHYGIDRVIVNDENEMNPEQQAKLSSYMAALFAAVGNEGELAKTIKFKMRNIAQSEILARSNVNLSDMAREVDYWDTYHSAPIAAHSGKVNKLYTGKLYHPNRYQNQPQFKFPEFAAGLCSSFDFSALDRGVSAECDTIMYIYFDNDSVKVVKYFYTSRMYQKQIETDYEEVMTVGSWFLNETEGESRIAGHFYLTDIDDREEVAPTLTTTTIRGDDKGYDSQPFFAFDEFFWRPGTLWRNRYFTHHTKTETLYDREVEIGVLVPMFNRNTVLHAKRESGKEKVNSESLSLHYVQDPYSYRYWTYHSVFAWAGSLEKMTGEPFPKNGNPVWVEIQKYDPSIYNEFANNGPWIGGLPVDYGWLIHPNSNEWLHSGGGGPPKVKEYAETQRTGYSQTGNLKWTIHDNIVTISNQVPRNQFFISSPSEAGLTMSATSSRVSLGESEYANISEADSSGTWKHVGYSGLVNHTRAYHFIGVINE